MVCGDSHPEGLKTGFGNDRTPVDTSPGRAGERTAGKDGGKRKNVIRNDGTRIVSTSSTLEEGGASLTLQGGDEATAITSVQSSAVGIEGGEDQDKIINTGTVTATARAEAPRIQVELNLTDTSHGDTSTYIRSRATGVSGGNGNDEIINPRTIAVQTTDASGSGTVEPSAVSIGILGGSGNDRITNSGSMTVSASSDASSPQATAKGIVGADGGDLIVNTGTLDASGTASGANGGSIDLHGRSLLQAGTLHADGSSGDEDARDDDGSHTALHARAPLRRRRDGRLAGASPRRVSSSR